jgi:hypothetical protein
MKSKWIKILLGVLICFLVFCAISVFMKVFTIGDLHLNFMAALLGTVITAVVTVLLLSGQSAAEEVKERNVAVFNDKSKIFKKFIKAIWEIWKDHQVTSDEYWNLTSMFYQKLMLYSKEETQKIIGGALKKIGNYLDIDANENKIAEEALRENIVVIIDTLIKDLSLGGKIDPQLFQELDGQMEKARERIRSERTTFKMLGIKKGTELVCKKDNTITCITQDETNKVLFGDEVRSISSVAVEINDGKAANGFDWFMLNGKTLWEMRKK